jgi:hypothetical protein
LMLTEIAVRRSVKPICSAIDMNRCEKTESCADAQICDDDEHSNAHTRTQHTPTCMRSHSVESDDAGLLDTSTLRSPGGGGGGRDHSAKTHTQYRLQSRVPPRPGRRRATTSRAARDTDPVGVYVHAGKVNMRTHTVT